MIISISTIDISVSNNLGNTSTMIYGRKTQQATFDMLFLPHRLCASQWYQMKSLSLVFVLRYGPYALIVPRVPYVLATMSTDALNDETKCDCNKLHSLDVSGPQSCSSCGRLSLHPKAIKIRTFNNVVSRILLNSKRYCATYINHHLRPVSHFIVEDLQRSNVHPKFRGRLERLIP